MTFRREFAKSALPFPGYTNSVPKWRATSTTKRITYQVSTKASHCWTAVSKDRASITFSCALEDVVRHRNKYCFNLTTILNDVTFKIRFAPLSKQFSIFFS